MSAIPHDEPVIDDDAGGFRAQFSVEASEDFPQRCFEALARHHIAPRSLSIFREPDGRNRLAVTLTAGLCARSEFRKVLDELTQMQTREREFDPGRLKRLVNSAVCRDAAESGVAKMIAEMSAGRC